MRPLALVLLASCGSKDSDVAPLDPRGWRALAEDVHPALVQAFDEELDPQGTWKLDGLSALDGPLLRVEPVTQGVFDLWFFPSEAEGENLPARAAAIEGVLVLLEPVALFDGEPVSALFPVRTHGREGLVPDLFLARLGGAEPRLDAPSEGASGWIFLRSEAPTRLDSLWIATPPGD